MQFVIYEYPADYPEHFVVRRWEITPGSALPGDGSLHDTLEEARTMVPPGLVCLPRAPDDDAAIVEVWT